MVIHSYIRLKSKIPHLSQFCMLKYFINLLEFVLAIKKLTGVIAIGSIQIPRRKIPHVHGYIEDDKLSPQSYI